MVWRDMGPAQGQRTDTSCACKQISKSPQHLTRFPAHHYVHHHVRSNTKPCVLQRCGVFLEHRSTGGRRKVTDKYPTLIEQRFYAGRCPSCGGDYDYTKPCNCLSKGPTKLTKDQVQRVMRVESKEEIYQRISERYRNTLDRLGE